MDTGEGLHNIVTEQLEESKKRYFYFPQEVPYNVLLEYMFSNNSTPSIGADNICVFSYK